MDKKLARIGFAGTIIYLLLVLAMTWNRLPDLWDYCTEINAVGDFLAGAFAPLAFLWLVLGYFQQSESLRLQIKELTNSVEQQTALVATNEEQLRLNKENAEFEKRKLEASVEPRFSLSSRYNSISNEAMIYAVTLYNGGYGITCVEIEQENQKTIKLNGLPHGGKIDFEFKMALPQEGCFDFIKVRYLNGLNSARQVYFRIDFIHRPNKNPSLNVVNPSGTFTRDGENLYV